MRAFTSSLNTRHSYYPPSEELTHQILSTMADDHVLLVAWARGERVGVIGGMATSHPFNPDVSMLAEIFWWVPEAHRGSRAGYLLLREFMKMGKLFDLTTVALEHTSPVSDKMMARFGLKCHERTYHVEN